MKTLNEAFSTRFTRRRYEAWFIRLGLADGSGAWWFRYLLMNPGRAGCPRDPRGMPAQVWATWFPSQGRPQSFIQGFPLEGLHLSGNAGSPFRFQIADNVIEENSCQGSLQVDGHYISWDLQYRSMFQVTLSNKGWIGFTRTPHSDAVFSGKITLDGRNFEASPLGFGQQASNSRAQLFRRELSQTRDRRGVLHGSPFLACTITPPRPLRCDWSHRELRRAADVEHDL